MLTAEARSGHAPPAASCLQTRSTHTPPRGTDVSAGPARPTATLSHGHVVICSFLGLRKTNCLFLKKEVTTQRVWGPTRSWGYVVSFPTPVVAARPSPHPPTHTNLPDPTTSFNTPAALPKPGSLLSVRFYFGSLDSALEFCKPGRNWPGLGTFLCPPTSPRPLRPQTPRGWLSQAGRRAARGAAEAPCRELSRGPSTAGSLS